jgi:ribosomal protein S6E (S10)
VEEEPVVVGLAGDDESAQEEDGQREELLIDEEQTVEHAARAAVAVGEWMDGLKLVVGGGHSLCGMSGRHGGHSHVLSKAVFCDMSWGYVVGGNASRKRVAFFRFS